MNQSIKLAIVDDSPFFRAGMVNLIQTQENFKILIESSNGKELLDSLEVIEQKPDIIVLDLEMPIIDGIKASEHIVKFYPKIKILILTIHSEENVLRHLIDRGVNGFLQKDKSIDKVIEAINVIHKHDFYFAGLDFKKILAAKNSLSGEEINFTKRELEVFKLICEQYTNKKISDKLFISIRTVHGHRNKIFKKTNTQNVAGLVMYGVKHNLISQY